MEGSMLINFSIPPQGNAVDTDVVEGKTFTSSGSFMQKTGTLADNRGDTVASSGATAQGDAGGTIHVNPPSGDAVYNNSSVITIADSDFVAANIKNGVTCFGLTGSYNGSSGAQAGSTTNIPTASITITDVSASEKTLSFTATVPTGARYFIARVSGLRSSADTGQKLILITADEFTGVTPAIAALYTSSMQDTAGTNDTVMLSVQSANISGTTGTFVLRFRSLNGTLTVSIDANVSADVQCIA